VLAGVFLWLLRRRQAACRRCPHDRGSHRSYVPGGSKPGYCAACECWQYKPERPWALALAYLRERPAPVTAHVLRPRPVPFPLRAACDEDDDDRTLLGIRVAPYMGRPRGGRGVRR
jgi:hypothetical protein